MGNATSPVRTDITATTVSNEDLTDIPCTTHGNIRLTTICRVRGFALIGIQLYPESERGRNTGGVSECVTIDLSSPTGDGSW